MVHPRWVKNAIPFENWRRIKDRAYGLGIMPRALSSVMIQGA